MYDREDVIAIAEQIVCWEIAAQQLPLPDLTTLLADCQNELAYSLNAFQDLYDHADHVPVDNLSAAIGAVACLATTTAILTLGLSQRARLTAQQN
jgi:hypothetical protein